MKGHLDDLDLMDDASGTDSKLLHLLTCPECRSRTIRRLLEETLPAETDELPLELGYDTVFQKLARLDPALLEESRARRAGAERLLEELLALPVKLRCGALREDERFQNEDLLECLLEQSQACQLTAPRVATELARLAGRLAELLMKWDEQLAEALVRALCLEGNALRLAGFLRQAERKLGQAASFLDTAELRAHYCRTLALVRWEQARPDEAMALLERATRLYGASGPPGEQGVCIALLGLFTAEERGPVEALAFLYRGWALMDRDLRPPLTARVGLSLALGLTEAEEIEQAGIVQREAWHFMAAIEDQEEILRLYWLEARVLGQMGKRAEAVHLLEAVLHSLIDGGSLAEAALASLDLALLREEGDLDSIVTLLQSFNPPAGPLRNVLDTCINVLRELDSSCKNLLKVTRDSLWKVLRAVSLSMKPVPFF